MNKKLEQLTSPQLGKLFPIILTKHNPDWSEDYRKEKIILEKALGKNQVVRIVHIGSTAVKHLISKPTIDILLEVPVNADNQYIIEKIRSMEYHFLPQPDKPPPHMMFVKGYTEQGFKGQAFHIHVRYPGDWDEVYFRDYLRDHPEAAGQYAELKLKLAKKYRNDRDGYTEAKTDFIKRISEIARKEKMQKDKNEEKN
ncbi:MAG: hypothetical protein APR63_01835 [Desulfuromonas sp. SDB]|nr:MAG: hypothetical protein APR63_01835 [Desulfuromonas sp. SDB]